MSTLTINCGQASHVLDRLEKVSKTCTGWQARCPAHNDKTPSLSISIEGDKILLNCFAGCKAPEIVSALGITMADLFTDKTRSSGASIVVAHYEYKDESGNPLFRV